MRTIVTSLAILCAVLSLGLPSSSRAQWAPDGVAIAAYANLQYDQRILADGAGGAYIVWTDYRDGQADIYLQRIDSDGERLWAAGGVDITPFAGTQSEPYMCSDGSGGVIVAYADYASGNYDIYAQRVNDHGTVQWSAGGVPVCVTTGNQELPRITSDGAGGAVVGWIDSRTSSRQIYAQRIDGNGAAQWALNGRIVCNSTGTPNMMEMTADDSSYPIFVWQDYRNVVSDVYAQRINLSGTGQWTANGVQVCTASNSQFAPQLVCDGTTGAVITWYDYRNGADYNIYAQHLDGTGARTWSNTGHVICQATDNQLNPQLVSDGSGGAIITWRDYRGTTVSYYDVYAQRINSAGTVQWTANGVAICDAARNQTNPVLVADGAGGAIIAWEDQRIDTDYDVYAQRINASGVTQWLVGGKKVSAAINNQISIQIVSDGTQGAILAWTDYRTATNSWDIYAQRIDKWGYWGRPEPVIAAVADVPHDEGGRVAVTWTQSRLDAYPEQQIVKYTIWRSTDDLKTWTLRDSIDAYYLDSYMCTAATTADSSFLNQAWQWFKVRAKTLAESYWWESKPMRGHSVDNLAPGMPGALAAEARHAPEGLGLTWAANAEPDLDHYAVYRGVGADFAPATGNRIASPTEALWFDGDWRWNGGFCYKVSAIDAHGNESAFALVTPDNLSGTGEQTAPASSFLGQNFPNPFNPVTKIVFGLKEPAAVSLRVYDAAGRLVAVLVEGGRAAGTHSEIWDGRDVSGRAVSSGIYFYKLTAGQFEQTRKMILLR